MFRELVILLYLCDSQWIFLCHTAYQSLQELSFLPQCPPHPQWLLWCSWLHSRWWGRNPQLHVCSGTDKKQWHSIQCHLHTAGDMIELCIELVQTHPKGVLWYLATELVVFFHSTDEMLVIACGIIKAMALCKEPIHLQISPPLLPVWVPM